MKRFPLSVVAIALIATSASAADFPVEPVAPLPVVVPFSWNGFYLGLNAGANFGQFKLATQTSPGVLLTPANAALIDSATPFTLHPRGAVAGFQLGYNWQLSNNIVLGLEFDAEAVGAKSTRTVTFVPGGNFTTSSINGLTLVTLRPRVGWAWDRSLIYVTGGAAGATMHTTDTFAGFGGTLAVSTSGRPQANGWTVGTGFEYAFLNAWSAKIEYVYVDLKNYNTSVSFSPVDVITFNHKYSDNIIRAGVNYRFGW
jgi:outer membrane immunogenic protein